LHHHGDDFACWPRTSKRDIDSMKSCHRVSRDRKPSKRRANSRSFRSSLQVVQFGSRCFWSELPPNSKCLVQAPSKWSPLALSRAVALTRRFNFLAASRPQRRIHAHNHQRAKTRCSRRTSSRSTISAFPTFFSGQERATRGQGRLSRSRSATTAMAALPAPRVRRTAQNTQYALVPYPALLVFYSSS
jgi:hypothetical protein